MYYTFEIEQELVRIASTFKCSPLAALEYLGIMSPRRYRDQDVRITAHGM